MGLKIYKIITIINKIRKISLMNYLIKKIGNINK